MSVQMIGWLVIFRIIYTHRHQSTLVFQVRTEGIYIVWHLEKLTSSTMKQNAKTGITARTCGICGTRG